MCVCIRCTYGHDAVVGHDVDDVAVAGDAIEDRENVHVLYENPLDSRVQMHLPAAVVDDDVAAVDAADGPLELVPLLFRKKTN